MCVTHYRKNYIIKNITIYKNTKFICDIELHTKRSVCVYNTILSRYNVKHVKIIIDK